jgi:membrane protein
MFGLALLGILHLESAWTDHLAPQVHAHVSRPVFGVIDDVARTGMHSRRLFWLTAGLVLAVWEMSGAMRALMDVLSRIYGDEDDRPKVRRYLVSFAMAVGVGGGVLGVIALNRFATAGAISGVAGWLIRWPVCFLLLTAVVWMVMRFAPARPESSGWLTLGSALCVLGWIGGSVLFGLYVSDVANYSSVMSSLGAVFVLMTYLYVSAICLLGGAQLDALMRGRAIGPSRIERLRTRVSGGRRRSRPAAGTPRPAR